MQPGTQLGHYEILEAIGKGGMGEVWRAKDSKLGRDVAIKTLPPEFADDPDRLARFEREARLLASLNHPNVAAIYGFEHDQGTHFLVMELVEGDTLADAIKRGPMGVEDSLKLALQIADALKAAHEKGVIHRDLKPANVKVTPEGTVKVLDFGLAKALSADESDVDVSNSPTLSMQATQQGVILGTAAYMSPEQAKGRAVDRRADVFAFGCVLYEMLTGRQSFGKSDVTESLSAVISLQPDWTTLPANLNPRLRETVERCLEKQVARRYQDIGDVRVDIEQVLEDPDGVIVGTAPDIRQEPARSKLGWIAAIVVCAIVAGAGAWSLKPAPNDRGPRFFQVEAGDGISFPYVSNDGSRVVFVRDDNLVVRSLEDGSSYEIDVADGVSYPFWSPDGDTIAYFAGGNSLRAVRARGGGDRELANDVFAPWNATWCDRGVIFSRWAEGLFVVPDGGQEQPLVPVDTASGEDNLAFPHCLPDGRILAGARHGDTGGEQRVSIILIDGEERLELWSEPEALLLSPMFVPPNSVLVVRGQARYRNPSLWRLPVSEDVSRSEPPLQLLLDETGQISMSGDGLLVSLTGVRTTDGRRLRWVDRAGQLLSEFGQPQESFSSPSLSSDDTRVAVARTLTGPAEVSIHTESRAQRFAVIENSAQVTQAWSPDGQLIAYSSTPDRNDDPAIMVRLASGGGASRIIPIPETMGIGNASLAWTPDGEALVFASRGPSGEDGGDIWMHGLEDGATIELLMEGRLSEPAVSPDGRLLAYVNWESGSPEVFVTTFPNPGPRSPVTGGQSGRHPKWNPQGDELFYLGGPAVQDDPNSRRDLYAVRIDADQEDPVGEAEMLFNGEAVGVSLTYTGSPSYDVASDGERFIVSSSGLEGTPVISVIDNVTAWIEAQQ